MLLALGVLAVWVQSEPGGRVPAFALICGVALGVSMQRSRFCFYCHIREWLEERDPRGVLAILLAIAVGLIGYTVVLGSWLPEPKPGNLPPDIHIGPVSWVLALAGLVFGAGMVISGSCISAHFYRLAEGSPTAPFALLGVGLGFVFGFQSWNTLYSVSVSEAPILWAPTYLGYGGALLLQLGILALVAGWVWQRFAARTIAPAPAQNGAAPPIPSLGDIFRKVWGGKWSYWVGGLFVGLISVLAVIRMKPLGMTGSIASAARALAAKAELIPVKLNGLDGFAGCASVVQDTWLTAENLLLLGLVGGAFVAALASAGFKLQKPGRGHVVRGLVGGVLLGWGAMSGLGCTIGTLLSGTQAGAVSGWVFGATMLVAIQAGLKVKACFVQRYFS
ncbi:membrane protein [Betaproteobacteria bacterium]|nr:membrane protein [Betaproteobacteria bacterium]GHU22803.1 membrane protein [Betaproteobacteria bacterium]